MNIKNKLKPVIIFCFSTALLFVLDHYRIHGYLFDAHDVLLQTDSGLGFDSHEFFVILFTLLGLLFVGGRLFMRRNQK